MSWIDLDADDIRGDMSGLTIRRAQGYANDGDQDLFLADCNGRSYLIDRTLAEILDATRNLPTTLGRVADVVGEKLQRSLSPAQIRYVINRNVRPMLEAPSRTLMTRSGFLFKAEVFGAELVDRVASVLVPLFRPAAVAILSALSVASIVAVAVRVEDGVTARGWFELLVAVALFIGSVVVHEFGHAAALKRHGEEPGPIGFGLYLVFPAFYSDVTKAWRLPRIGRMSVDLGGAYLQAVLLIPLLAAAVVFGQDHLLITCWLIIGAIAFNFSPLLRLDGHWLLVDLLGARDATRHLGRVLGGVRRGRVPNLVDAAGLAFFFIGAGAYLWWLGRSLLLVWIGSGVLDGDQASWWSVLNAAWLSLMGAVVAIWTGRKLVDVAREFRIGAKSDGAKSDGRARTDASHAAVGWTPAAARRESWREMQLAVEGLSR